ncbi:MAG: hypothetical protein FJ218_08535 [Ignavibacteria bacterium]|nr:hypothetical protein [Ignavibacteria bacterium]
MHHQKITPFLGFGNNAEAAVNFYTSIFKDSKILNVARYGEDDVDYFLEQTYRRWKQITMRWEN